MNKCKLRRKTYLSRCSPHVRGIWTAFLNNLHPERTSKANNDNIVMAFRVNMNAYCLPEGNDVGLKDGFVDGEDVGNNVGIDVGEGLGIDVGLDDGILE